MEMEQSTKAPPKTYCVTGATGYIGSWLVSSLLQRGFLVHATLRDPGKASHLLPKWKAEGRLKLFEADLQNEGSFDEAVKGCDGVFHVAASMEFTVKEQPDIESYVKSNIIEPAIKGTLNLLKSCTMSKTVKRVVLTSSISTMTAKDSNGNWIPVVDESCQVDAHDVWNTKASGWVYVLSKLLTEKAAFKFANENGLDLLSVITPTVAGPFITPTVPSSLRVLLSPITGDPQLFPILNAVNTRMGSIALAHVDDICNAHVFLMLHPKAQGRHMCCTLNCHISKLVHLLVEAYPRAYTQRITSENGDVPSEISSKKLKDLGFKYKYSLVDIIDQTIRHCIGCSYLPS